MEVDHAAGCVTCGKYVLFLFDAVLGSIDTHVHEEVEDETQRMFWKPGLELECA
jgi:hypothetical protein